MIQNTIQAPYLQIKSDLVADIKKGVYVPRDRIPSETALMKKYGVARMTANRALKELTAEGVLTRVPGVGTFVAEKRDEGHAVEVRDIADEIRSRGHKYQAEVIIREIVQAEGRIAELFHRKRSQDLYHTRIVHMEGRMPLQLEDRWVNPDLVPNYLVNDFQERTPTAYLLSKVPLQDVEHTIRAEMPSEEFRSLLKMPEDEPCLVLTRRTSMNDRIITFARLYFPASRYRLGSKSGPASGLE